MKLKFLNVLISKTHFDNLYLMHLLLNYGEIKATGLHCLTVNIGSGNGLVPSGNKPLPETMLIKIYVTIWHQ